MSQTLSTPRSLIRVTVQCEGRRLDIGVPAGLPLVELMPGLARSLGVLDASTTHAGFALVRADGTALDPSRGPAEQDVGDGELLTLARGGLLAQPRVYDDIVEAVIDATQSQHTPWTPRDNARTALAASLTLLGICAVLLVAAGPSIGVGAIIAASGAVVLLAVAAVVSRLGQADAGSALGLAAGGFGAVAGYLAVPAGGAVWGWPLAAAGLGAVIVGGGALALCPARRELQLIPLGAGVVVGITASVAALMPAHSVGAYAVMISIVATLGGALPWLVLSSTRIRVISPQSDAEVFADPRPIDNADVARRVETGQRALVALRVALGIAALIAVAPVASANPAGALLGALAFLSMMFPSRQSFARGSVAVLMSLGTVGLAATGVTVALTQPGLRVVALVALIVAAAVVVTVTLLAPGARIRLARLADILEVTVLAVLLPLGVIAAGLA